MTTSTAMRALCDRCVDLTHPRSNCADCEAETNAAVRAETHQETPKPVDATEVIDINRNPASREKVSKQ